MSRGKHSLCRCEGCGVIFNTEDEVVVEDEEGEGGLDEEVRPMRKAITPRTPGASEMEDHRKPHLPYRSWRPWCVTGR